MLFLLDANVLIDANRDYYPLERVSQFWDWLVGRGSSGDLKVPIEIFDEIAAGNDDLAAWIKQPNVREALVLDESVDVGVIVESGYGSDLDDVELVKLGKDPFLVAYAYADPSSRCVVTTETSSPRKKRANRKIPDVCSDFGIRCVNAFQLVRELDFRT
jgi:hypothetical protein